MTTYDPGRHMLADEIAAAVPPGGVARKTVIMAQTRARSARRQAALLAEGGMDAAQADREADNGPWQLPEQAGKLTRRLPATTINAGGTRVPSHDRTVTQPFWDRAEIATWLHHRRGPGGRSAAGAETAEVA